MSSNHTCPISRSPITAGDPVLALATPDVKVITVWNESLIELLAEEGE